MSTSDLSKQSTIQQSEMNSFDLAKASLYQKIRKFQENQKADQVSVSHKNYYIPINVISVSPCGRYLAFGTTDGSLKIIEIPNYNLIQNIIVSGIIHSLNFSPSGKYILCKYQEILLIYNFPKKYIKFRISTSLSSPLPALFTSDEKYLINPEKESIVFWSFSKNIEIFQLNGHENPVTSIALSLFGKILLSGSSDGLIIVWNVEIRREIFKLKAHKKSIKSLAISNNDKFAASLSELYLKVWDLEKRCEFFTFQHVSINHSVSFSPDSNFLALSSNDDFVRLFNVDEKLLKNFYFCGNDSKYKVITFSPDQKKLIAGDYEGRIIIWNIKKKAKQISYYQNFDGDEISYISHDNQYFGLSSFSKGLKIFNIEKNRIEFILTENKIVNMKIKVSDDSRFLMTISINDLTIWDLITKTEIFKILIITSNKRFYCTEDLSLVAISTTSTSIRVWNTMKICEFNITGNVQHSTACFSKDCRFFVIGFVNGLIKISYFSVMGRENHYKVHTREIFKIIFTEDQKSIISMSYDYCIKIWNTINQTVEHSFYSPEIKEGPCSIFGNHLITPSIKNSFIFWNLKEKTQEFEINPQNFSSKFSYHNKSISFFYEYHVDVWTFSTFLKINTIDQYKNFIPIKFSRNKKFAVSGHEKYLKLWNVDQGNEILSFKAHKRWIRTVSFSHDSQFFISGADDGCVKIWDLNGNEIQCFKRNSSWVMAAALSRDGKFLVWGSSDKVVSLWKVGMDHEMEAFRGLDKVIYSICFSKSQKFFAVELIRDGIKVLKV